MESMVKFLTIIIPLALIVIVNQWKVSSKVAYCIKWSLYPAAIFSYGLVGPLINPMFKLPAAMPMTNAVQGWAVCSLFCGLVFYAIGLIIWNMRHRKEKWSRTQSMKNGRHPELGFAALNILIIKRSSPNENK